VLAPDAHEAGGPVARDDIREPLGDRAGAGRFVGANVGLEEKRGIQGKPEIGTGPFHELDDSVTGAGDELVMEMRRAPGKTNPRLEALVTRLIKSAAVSVLPCDALLPRERVDA